MKNVNDDKNIEKKDKNKSQMEHHRLLKIKISFVILILISIFIYFYDKYTYHNESNRLEALKKQALNKEDPIPIIFPDSDGYMTNNDIDESITEEEPYNSPIDFEYWKNINPDVIAYIKVPGTNIDYPILYDANDNERYLHESIDGKKTVHGSIYLDSIANSDFTSLNNLLYGHNMRDGSMFKDVVKYKDFKYLQGHNKVIIYLPNREIKLKAIAAFYGTPDGNIRKVDFSDNEEFHEFVEQRLSLSKNVDSLPNGNSKNITQLFCLVTCSYEFNNARTFLYCVKESDYEK